VSDWVGTYELSRRLKPLIAAAADGAGPVLVNRHHRPVALLVSVEMGLRATAAAGAPDEVGMTRLMDELSRVLRTVEKEGHAVVITRHRRSLAMFVPAEGQLMDDYRQASQRHFDKILRQLVQQSAELPLGELLRELEHNSAGPTMDEVLRQLE